MKRALILAALMMATPPSAYADLSAHIGESVLGNIYIAGDPITFPVSGQGERVQWHATDFFGRIIASGEEQLFAGAANLKLRVDKTGYFTLDTEIMRGGRQTGSAQTAFAIVPLPKPELEKSPFGVMTHFAKGWPPDIIPLIRKAGIVHIRDEQPWRQVEKQRADYEFDPRLAGYMAALDDQHIDPLVVLAFANPLYDGGKTPFSDEGRAAYAAYASAVVRNYQPRLRSVEIWNEYNGSFCEGPCRTDRAGYYASMLQDVYRSLKRDYPSLTVLGGAAVPIPLDYFRALFDKGALQSMDAIVIHPYRPHPEGVEQDIEALRRLMARYGAPKPIWATEFSDLADMHKSRDDVARYLVRMATILMSAKVERIYWYLLRDYHESTGLGLLHDDDDPLGRYTPTPAFAAYATLIHLLDGATFVSREPSDPRVHIYSFAAQGGEVRVAWSAASNVKYDVSVEKSLKVIDMMGGETTLLPHNGMVSLTIDQDPVYISGNATLTPQDAGVGAVADLAADLAADFTLEQQAKGWSYGIVARPDGKLSVGTSFPTSLKLLQVAPLQDGWMTPESPTLKIKATVMHPGRINGEAAWAVRRWSTSTPGIFRISGAAELGDGKSVGATFAIVVNGHVDYAVELGGKEAANTRFDLPLHLPQGAAVDFVLGPNPDGGINFDAARISAVISRETR